MTYRTLVALGMVAVCAASAQAGPTRSSAMAVGAGDVVFAVNPDSNTVARLDYSGMLGTLTHEQAVGAYPRNLALAGSYVFVTSQSGDSVSRLDQATLGNRQDTAAGALGVGCNPFGIAPTPDESKLLVSCQGTSTVVVLDLQLNVLGTVALAWPNARAIAIASDGGKAYVTHFLTEEPGTDGHVSVVDVPNKSVAAVFTVGADLGTCETQNSGGGVLNLLNSVVLIPDGAPSDVAGQLWVGGVQQNVVTKGLFKREATIKSMPGAALFPLAPFKSFPDNAIGRNIYRASFHDVIRFGIVKLNAADGARVGKLDIDEAAQATDIEISADGTVAYVVDQTFNTYHLFNTKKGQGSDVTTLFAAPGAFGPGGANPSEPCVPDALRPVTGEGPFRMSPQSQISTLDGYNPVRFDGATYQVVDTGVDFDAVHYWNTGQDRMRKVPDGVGTAPIGIRLSADGQRAYVLNYLARNVVVVGTAEPKTVGGKPANLRCSGDVAQSCETNNDCPAAAGFCNHPGGAACQQDSDCGSAGPCIRGSDCVPLILADAVSTITGGLAADALPPAILDGKILFNTAARDASVPNNVGLAQAAPLFNDARLTDRVPGSVVSTAHDASYVTCTTCHADYGGQDGRTWDFSQFGASLRNTMDLRGRAGFAPGQCSNAPSQECFFDAACGQGNTCKANPARIPPNIPVADRDRWFNPMLTVHWNGDRDEVEDFESTYRSLQGSGDCETAEDASTCEGALVQRSPLTSSELPRQNSNKDLACPLGCAAECPESCNDVEPDLGAPNRNLPGAAGHNVGYRLTHMADFVYSLTSFVKNPNPSNAQAERGRALFNDATVNCSATCHNGGPATKQFFTDKAPNTAGFDPNLPARMDTNNPFIRHDVGTANVFDTVDPHAIAAANQLFQNARLGTPGIRAALGEYVTPVLNDVWATAPYLHDGSAYTLLDVIRPCNLTTDDCTAFGRGRNLHTQDAIGRHGTTDVLTPSQLNDLVAFQKSLTTASVVGTPSDIVRAGRLHLKKFTLAFARVVGKAGKTKPGRFAMVGTIQDAPGPLAPADGVRVELAFPDPAAGVMRILEVPFTMKGAGKKFSGKASAGGGALKLTLRARGTASFSVMLAGKGLDLAALDTGNRDLTVAFEISRTTFARNRYLAEKKGVFALPKRRS